MSTIEDVLSSEAKEKLREHYPVDKSKEIKRKKALADFNSAIARQSMRSKTKKIEPMDTQTVSHDKVKETHRNANKQWKTKEIRKLADNFNEPISDLVELLKRKPAGIKFKMGEIRKGKFDDILDDRQKKKVKKEAHNTMWSDDDILLIARRIDTSSEYTAMMLNRTKSAVAAIKTRIRAGEYDELLKQHNIPAFGSNGQAKKHDKGKDTEPQSQDSEISNRDSSYSSRYSPKRISVGEVMFIARSWKNPLDKVAKEIGRTKEALFVIRSEMRKGKYNTLLKNHPDKLEEMRRLIAEGDAKSKVHIKYRTGDSQNQKGAAKKEGANVTTADLLILAENWHKAPKEIGELTQRSESSVKNIRYRLKKGQYDKKLQKAGLLRKVNELIGEAPSKPEMEPMQELSAADVIANEAIHKAKKKVEEVAQKVLHEKKADEVQGEASDRMSKEEEIPERLDINVPPSKGRRDGSKRMPKAPEQVSLESENMRLHREIRELATANKSLSSINEGLRKDVRKLQEQLKMSTLNHDALNKDVIAALSVKREKPTHDTVIRILWGAFEYCKNK